MDSMMYTKGEAFDVALTGGSPWGFTIRTQSGNGYNRGRVIVAKVVQGGKADSSGNIHVGDEILAVNGFEFDNEQEATDYVRVAKKELVLKVKRGQDKRRMNIRLANVLPNNFAAALESPHEKNIVHSTMSYTDNDNNKRSSKEFEKDMNYKAGSYMATTIMDYQTPDTNQARVTTRSDLSEYSSLSRDHNTQDNTSRRKHSKSVDDAIMPGKLIYQQRPRLQRQLTWSGQRSPPRKSYNPPATTPDKVQRVRVRSTNVTSLDHYKYSPGADKSPSFDENQNNSDSRSSTPGYSPPTDAAAAAKAKQPFSSTAMADLNRTWPSVTLDVPNKDTGLAVHKSLASVSTAKLQFEELTRPREQGLPRESAKKSSLPVVAPKPPSRNSSFRSSRLSSSSAVFADTTSETTSLSPDRKGSSAEDLDKPLPPRRFSHSKVLTSFRSSKRPMYHGNNDGTASKGVYHHSRTQSLPTSELQVIHLSSKSWVGSTGRDYDHDVTSREQPQRLPRSSSFSRARVIETSSVKTVHRDEPPAATAPMTAIKPRERGVIQAHRTVEASPAITPQQNVVTTVTKPVPFPKQGKVASSQHRAGVAGLKENSLMQQLLMESQGQKEASVRSKAAAIQREIDQQSDTFTPPSRPFDIQILESAQSVQNQRAKNSVAKQEELPGERSLPFRAVSEIKPRKDMKAMAKSAEVRQVEVKQPKDTNYPFREVSEMTLRNNVEAKAQPAEVKEIEIEQLKATAKPAEVKKIEVKLPKEPKYPFREVSEIKPRNDMEAKAKPVEPKEPKYSFREVSEVKPRNDMEAKAKPVEPKEPKYSFREVSEVKPRNDMEAKAKPVELKEIEIKQPKDINYPFREVSGIKPRMQSRVTEKPAKVEVIETQQSKDAQKFSATVEKFVDTLLENHDTPAVKEQGPYKIEQAVVVENKNLPIVITDQNKPTGNQQLVENDFVVDEDDEDVFPDPPEPYVSPRAEDESNIVESEAPSIEKYSVEELADSSATDAVVPEIESSKVIDIPEVVAKEEAELVVESCPPAIEEIEKDASEHVDTRENGAELQPNTMVDLKDDSAQRSQFLSPFCDASLKVIHSRENSASSLLEETLESAKTIASIYSVQGPTRIADEDSVSTASEMRRYSLAKRGMRKKPARREIENNLKSKSDQSLLTPERTKNIFNDPGSPVDLLSAEDENGTRSASSISSTGSRSSSGLLSPKLEVLEEQKELLISSMKRKVELLKEQESEISDEMKQNDELGKRVAEDVKNKTSGTEYSKLQLFIGELNNIIGLLLSLTQRMHRYEIMLEDIDLAEDNGREKRDMLLKRMERVKQQYNEACTIKEINDKRGETVARFVGEYCSEEEFADFQHFVDMKTQLALTQAEIRDKIKLGEEKLNALTSASIDWSSFDLNSK